MTRYRTKKIKEKIVETRARRDARRQQGTPATESTSARARSRQEDPVRKAARIHNQRLISRLLYSRSISQETANLLRRRYRRNAERLQAVDNETLRMMGEAHKGDMPDHLLTEDEVLAEDARLKLAGGVEGAAVAPSGWHGSLVLGEGKKDNEEEVEEAYSSNWELEDEDEEMGEAKEIEETEVGEDVEKGKGRRRRRKRRDSRARATTSPRGGSGRNEHGRLLQLLP